MVVWENKINCYSNDRKICGKLPANETVETPVISNTYTIKIQIIEWGKCGPLDMPKVKSGA
jgi:hypothetical protein